MSVSPPPDAPILVTGAASGIGAEVVSRLLAAGRRVIALDRTPIASSPAEGILVDLTDRRAVDELAADLPPLAGLVNVAGVPGTAPADVVWGVNLLGLRTLTDQVMARMAPGATVVNVSSAVAEGWRARLPLLNRLVQAPDWPSVSAILEQEPGLDLDHYRLSKECVRLLTQTWAATHIGQVRVVSVSPGPVDTPILEDFKQAHGRDKVEGTSTLLGRYATPADVAGGIEFLLSEAAAWVNGTDLRIDGGLTAFRQAQEVAR